MTVEERPIIDVTILLVEDESALRELLLEVLTDFGYNVIAAASGAEALLITSTPGVEIDVLVTDIRMPGMNGPELVAGTKTHLPNIKVLYMSGYTDNPAFRQELAGDEAQFIQKPFAPDDLCVRIAKLIHA